MVVEWVKYVTVKEMVVVVFDVVFLIKVQKLKELLW